MSRVARLAAAACAPIALAIALFACDDGKKPAMPPSPAGPGYDDLRVLSQKDCEALRDRQIEIAVDEALVPDGGSPAFVDAGEKLQLEAALRQKMRAETDAWIKRCVGRAMPAKDFRCMRDATTVAGFNACGVEAETGVASASASSVPGVSGATSSAAPSASATPPPSPSP
jgi:hypothetical protein